MVKRFFLFFSVCCLTAALTAQKGYVKPRPAPDTEAASIQLLRIAAATKQAEQMLNTLGAVPEASNLLDSVAQLAKQYHTTTEGITFFFMKGYWFHIAHKLDSALFYYKYSEELATSAGSEVLRLRSITERANILRLKSQYILASQLNYELLPQVLQLNDTMLLKRLYMNMCSVLFFLNQPADMEKYGFAMLEIARKSGDSMYMRRAYDNIASANSSMERYDKAVTYVRHALNMGGIIAPREEILLNNNISEYYMKLGQPDSARIYLQKNMALIPHAQSEFLKGLTLVNRGTLYSLDGNRPAANRYFDQADSIFSKSGHEMYRVRTLALYADACRRMGDYKRADALLRKMIVIKDKLLSTEVQQRVAEFNTLYKLNEKETQLAVQEAENNLQQQILRKEKRFNLVLIVLLVLFLSLFMYSYYSFRKIKKLNHKLEEQKVIIEQQAEGLTASNRAKDKLFTIVSHDLRSPLGSYQELAETLAYLLHHKKYSEVEAIAQQIDANGKQLFLLLNSLLAWSLSEQSITDEEEQEIPLSEILDPVISIYRLVAQQKGLEFKINCQNGIRLTCKPGLLSLVLRNLLDNAIKYARQGQAVSITAVRENDAVIFRFCNAGENMAPGKLNTIKWLMASPADWHPGNKAVGTGLMLIQQCLIKLNRKIDVYIDNGQLCFELKY